MILQTKRLTRLTWQGWRNRQSIHYSAIWGYGEERLKVDIDRAFDVPSRSRLTASVCRRPNMKWSPVAELDIGEAACRRISPDGEGIAQADFERDEATLLERALMVIREDAGGDHPARLSSGTTPPEAVHAPEPWAESGMAIIQDALGRIVADCESPDLPDEEHRIIARRIVAAVNACEGISTEDLEDGARRKIHQALQMASNYMSDDLGEDDETEMIVFDAVRAALRLLARRPY